MAIDPLFLNLEGPMGSGKTGRLLAMAAHWLETLPNGEILILCSNHARQQRFTQTLLQTLTRPVGQIPVYTYAGWVRNALFNYWPLVENQIQETLGQGTAVMVPELCGLEDTEMILNRILDDYLTDNPAAFAHYPGNRASLVKQLVRRLRLRSENRLSRSEMTRRSILLEEMCLKETADIERLFDRISYGLRVLDPNKQIDVFQGLLEKDSQMAQDFRSQIRYLMVDDVDETIPAVQDFITWLAPNLQGQVLAADVDGGSRRGYLNAYPYDWEKLKRLRESETVSLIREDGIGKQAEQLLNNWRRVSDFAPVGPEILLMPTMTTQVDMLDQLAEDITVLLAQGHAPGEMTVVFPENNMLLFYQLQRRLLARGIPTQVLSGTTRPLDNPICRGLLYLVQLANTDKWGYRLSPIELKTILTQVLHLTQWDAPWVDRLVGHYLAMGTLPAPEECPPSCGHPGEARYLHLLAWLAKAQLQTFEQQLLSGFQELMTVYVAKETDRLAELRQWLEGFTKQKAIHERLKSLLTYPPADADFERYWLSLVKTGSMADTPDAPNEIDPTAIVIGSPQKMIDHEIRRQTQFWLDGYSRQWARTDDAPLYNAWVHSAVWDGETLDFSEDFKEELIRTRAAHITRTLMLLAQSTVRVYASELDAEGFAQNGLLRERLISVVSAETALQKIPRAILRSDQLPVLDYKQGTMAITAVPGAGKTFINVEMILELIERGIAPQQILVLTYMDSAAKTLLSRLKVKLPASLTQGGRLFPTICTIHSLAFRILMDNDHIMLLGYDPDSITVLDDIASSQILMEVASQTLPREINSVDQWARAVDRAIKQAKMMNVSPEAIEAFLHKRPQQQRLIEFLPAYRLYVERLRQGGQLDFTDMITKAVTLLENYPDIRAHYQAQYRVLIEDEAQDSSRLLQRLLALIGGESPNLIRTGDPNQSITTTFSAADPAVFREFIQSAHHVVRMNQSGRCAPEVIALANQWIEVVEKHPVLKGAFEPVAIQPVPGQNPPLLFPLSAQAFETEEAELLWLVSTIGELRQHYPENSVAVLVRRNEDASYMAGCLQKADIPAISLSESLNAHGVFTVILAYLQLLESPGDQARQETLYMAMTEASLLAYSQETHAALLSTNVFYQPPYLLQDEVLMQLVYDWLDFSRDAIGSNLGQLVIRITDRLFHTVGDRSNGYICALWVQDILKQQHWEHIDLSPLELVVRQLKTYQQSRRQKKGFSELLSENPNQFVQVMSLHKSKGQEFDFVLIPKLTSRLFRASLTEVKFKEDDKLLLEIERVCNGGKMADNAMNRVKTEAIQEEARLMFVGLTRARQGLYLSTHRQALYQGKLKPVSPAWCFEALSQCLAPTLPEAELVTEGLKT